MTITTNNINQLVDNLFRHEYGKLVAVLTKVFGIENIELAEDVVQDSLMQAMKDWQYKGVPSNPVAWLYTVAKNNALNTLNREKYKRKYSTEVEHTSSTENPLDEFFSENEIRDDQLRMIFVACHPSLSRDSQVAFTLKTLCGFSIPEIAHAFFTSEETVNKRLVRARQKVREAGIRFVIPGAGEMEKRLEAVLETIYLLFNEGYSASSGNQVIRFELCEESIRLARLLEQSPLIVNKTGVHALLALMLLNASRFNARLNGDGGIITLAEQNRLLWDKHLIQQGFMYLGKSTLGNVISIYHILATISAYHCAAPDFSSTDWKGILSMYNHLQLIDNSPLVKLNRAIAVAKVNGAADALEELNDLDAEPAFRSYHLLYSTKAELYIDLGDFSMASSMLREAIKFSTLESEKIFLQKKLESLPA